MTLADGRRLTNDILQNEEEIQEVPEVAEEPENDLVELSSRFLQRPQDKDMRGDDEHRGGHRGGCSGGCSGSRPRPPRVPEIDPVTGEEIIHPRPIFGLIGNILETARHGYRIDSPRAHLFF